MDRQTKDSIEKKINNMEVTQSNKVLATTGKAYNNMLEKSLGPIWKMVCSLYNFFKLKELFLSLKQLQLCL